MRTYLCTKFDWHSQICDSIDWLCHGRALNRLNPNDQIFVVKLIHEWLPLNSQKHWFNQHHASSCPVCRSTIENPNHFLRCSHMGYRDINSTFLRAIQAHCDKWSCHTDIARLLLLGIQHWPKPPLLEHPFSSTFRHVIASQSQIGWKQLLYGRFTTEWIYLHEITCTSQDTKHRDGERW